LTNGSACRRLDQRRYELILWCEHAGHWHPWPIATYRLVQTQDWLIRIGPNMNLVVKALKLVTPLAGPVAAVVMSDYQLQQAQHQLDLMAAVVAELPLPAQHEQGHLISSEAASRPGPAHADLRQ